MVEFLPDDTLPYNPYWLTHPDAFNLKPLLGGQFLIDDPSHGPLIEMHPLHHPLVPQTLRAADGGLVKFGIPEALTHLSSESD